MENIDNEQYDYFDRKFFSDIRTQFSVITNCNNMSALLGRLSYYGVNIDGFQIINVKNDKYLINFVAGSDSHESAKDINYVKLILDSLHLKYSTRKILKIDPPYVGPGILAQLYAELYANVEIYAIYNSESEAIYIDSSSMSKTAQIVDHLK